jgi:hypothetical protein
MEGAQISLRKTSAALNELLLRMLLSASIFRSFYSLRLQLFCVLGIVKVKLCKV